MHNDSKTYNVLLKQGSIVIIDNESKCAKEVFMTFNETYDKTKNLQTRHNLFEIVNLFETRIINSTISSS